VVSLQIVDNTATRSGPRSESSGRIGACSNELGLASVAIISGASLVEGGIDDLLGASGAARVHIMAGPTSPL
jgi:Putative heavy-metal chelation